MGHIHIAANQYRLVGLEFLEKIVESPVPLLAIVQAEEFRSGIGRIDIDQKEVRELRGDHPPFGVVLGKAEAVMHCQGRNAGGYGRTGIPFALGRMSVEFVPQHAFEGLLHLFRIGLGLLKTQYVGIAVVQKSVKVLFHHGADAVHVPRNDFHKFCPYVLSKGKQILPNRRTFSPGMSACSDSRFLFSQKHPPP